LCQTKNKTTPEIENNHIKNKILQDTAGGILFPYPTTNERTAAIPKCCKTKHIVLFWRKNKSKIGGIYPKRRSSDCTEMKNAEDAGKQ
jgi:hypothetical protein